MNNSVKSFTLNNGHQCLLEFYMYFSWREVFWGEERGLYYVASPQGSPLSAGFHHGNLIFVILCYTVK